MNKDSIHKSFSMAMAMLVLLSTLSFTVEKHYCGDTLMDAAIFSKVDPCCDIDFVSIMEIEKKSCCKDEIEVFKGQNNLKKVAFEDFHFIQQVFATALSYSYLHLFEARSEQFIPHKNYSPPYLVPDLRVLHQVFII